MQRLKHKEKNNLIPEQEQGLIQEHDKIKKMAYQKLQASRALEVFANNDIDIPNPAMLAISSTTTGSIPGKLVDANGDFIDKGVNIGDIIYNTTTSSSSKVTAVDSATELSITGSFNLGANYNLYATIDTPNNGCVLYVGVTGDVKLITSGGDTVTLVGVLACLLYTSPSPRD